MLQIPRLLSLMNPGPPLQYTTQNETLHLLIGGSVHRCEFGGGQLHCRELNRHCDQWDFLHPVVRWPRSARSVGVMEIEMRDVGVRT